MAKVYVSRVRIIQRTDNTPATSNGTQRVTRGAGAWALRSEAVMISLITGKPFCDVNGDHV
jgi:hypothetical protein